MEAKAQVRFLRASPQKLRLLAGELKGREVNEILAYLTHMPQRGARVLEKVIRSAMANAAGKAREAKADLDPESLYLQEIRVDQGPVSKRVEFRAMGRVNLIRKPTSHVQVILGEREGKKAAPGKAKKRLSRARGLLRREKRT